MKTMQAYLQAIINLDMYIKGGGGDKKNKTKINRNKLQSLSLQNHQFNKYDRLCMLRPLYSYTIDNVNTVCACVYL